MPEKKEKKTGPADAVSKVKKTAKKPAKTKIPVAYKVAPLSEESENFIKENFSNNDNNLIVPKRAAVVKPAEAEKKAEKKPARPVVGGKSLHLYRKISFSFIILTAVLLAAILYFSFVKVTIAVKLADETVSNNLIADIYGESAKVREGAVTGTIKKLEIEATRQFQPSGKNVTGQEAVGKAKIINNYEKNQPLVATTRLLTPDNKLFRIKDTVNVPANGTIEVEIYADDPKPESAIGPTKFSIPGLWAGLQDKIYAESSEPIKYQEKATRIIEQKDFDLAAEELKKALTEEARKKSSDVAQKYDQILFKVVNDSIKIENENKVGEEKEEFTMKIKAEVDLVAFNDDEIKKTAEQKLKSSLDERMELVGLAEDKIVYEANS